MDLDVIAVASFAAGPSGLRPKLGAAHTTVKPSYPQKGMARPAFYPPGFHNPLLRMDGWPRRSLRTVPRLRIQYQVPAGIAIQHELAADEVGIDDNIVVRRSPGNSALGVKGSRFELALDDAMLERRRAEHGHDTERAPCQRSHEHHPRKLALR